MYMIHANVTCSVRTVFDVIVDHVFKFGETFTLKYSIKLIAIIEFCIQLICTVLPSNSSTTDMPLISNSMDGKHCRKT